MILSDGTIQSLLDEGTLIVDPLCEHSIQPASIDLRLGNHYLTVEDRHMDMGVISLSEEIKYRELKGDTMIIPPHSFLLATTMEYMEIPDNMTAFVEGRSSVGRIGLFIQNAGWVDPGFKGQITLELYNANSLPIRLEAGRRICQLVLCSMDKPALNPYNGKYQGQKQSTGSRVFQDL
jgi:dCTP deaminase